MNYDNTYVQAHIWCCGTCGFIYEGGQPKMECPVCTSYKSNFVDFPQHLEAQVREAHPKLPPNHVEAREMRLELFKENHVKENARVRGRMLPGQSGEHIDVTLNDSLD